MMTEKMGVEEARSKLSEMLLELDRIPACCQNQVERDYRFYLEMNIKVYQTTIQAFDEVSAEL